MAGTPCTHPPSPKLAVAMARDGSKLPRPSYAAKHTGYLYRVYWRNARFEPGRHGPRPIHPELFAASDQNPARGTSSAVRKVSGRRDSDEGVAACRGQKSNWF